MIVWLASYPRSGNTFFRKILERSFGIPTADRYLKTEIFQNTEKLVPLENPELAIQELRASPDLQIMKTHDLPDNNDEPAIYLVRDGRDSIVSYTWFVLMTIHNLEKDEISRDLYLSTLRDLILEPNSPFGTWGENVIAWTRKPNTIVIRFENLIQSPLEQISHALDSTGIKYGPVEKAALPSFADLQKQEPLLFRQGKIGSWRNDMTDEHHELFWEKNSAAMQLMHYGDPPTTHEQ